MRYCIILNLIDEQLLIQSKNLLEIDYSDYISNKKESRTKILINTINLDVSILEKIIVQNKISSIKTVIVVFDKNQNRVERYLAIRLINCFEGIDLDNGEIIHNFVFESDDSEEMIVIKHSKEDEIINCNKETEKIVKKSINETIKNVTKEIKKRNNKLKEIKEPIKCIEVFKQVRVNNEKLEDIISLAVMYRRELYRVEIYAVLTNKTPQIITLLKNKNLYKENNQINIDVGKIKIDKMIVIKYEEIYKEDENIFYVMLEKK